MLLPPDAWPECHTPARCQAEATRAYGSSHIASSWDGLGELVTWTLFPSGVTAAGRNLVNDKLSVCFLLVRESQEESLRGLLLFSGSVSTCGREHSGLWFYPQQEGARKGNSCGLFTQFEISMFESLEPVILLIT